MADRLHRLRIIVSGYIVRQPVGGLTWHYLQYVLGLAHLGHEVFFVEDSEDYPFCFDPTRSSADPGTGSPRKRFGTDPTYGLKFAARVFDRVGLGGRWAYYDAHRARWFGPCADGILDICESADLFLNVSGSIPVRPWLAEIPARMLVDTDPAFTQVTNISVPIWLERATHHTAFATFAENYHDSRCTIPRDGLPWQTTRQPIVLDNWPVTVAHEKARLTTVMSWRSYDPGKHDGDRYGLKSDSFGPYVDLPQQAGAPLELAIDCPPRLRERLGDKGWFLRNALEVTQDPWTYQRYIQESMGEFSVAKHGYVVTRSGWFSERSAAYLASGRPVLTEETGFSDWIESGAGLIPFSTPREVVDGIEEIKSRYADHCAAARSIAAEYFDARRVLPELIERSLHPPTPPTGDAAGWPLVGMEKLQEYREQSRRITALVPPDDALILVDDGQWGPFGVVANRRCFPFLERDGQYWGRPADDGTAVRELERLRRAGARFIVFVKPAFWWLDHYSGLKSHLKADYSCVVEDQDLVAFDLRAGEQADGATGRSDV